MNRPDGLGEGDGPMPKYCNNCGTPVTVERRPGFDEYNIQTGKLEVLGYLVACPLYEYGPGRPHMRKYWVTDAG